MNLISCYLFNINGAFKFIRAQINLKQDCKIKASENGGRAEIADGLKVLEV